MRKERSEEENMLKQKQKYWNNESYDLKIIVDSECNNGGLSKCYFLAPSGLGMGVFQRYWRRASLQD